MKVICSRVFNSFKLFPEDVVIIAYQSVISILILFFRKNIANYSYFLLLTIAIIISVFLISIINHETKNKFLTLLRHWYFVITIVISYSIVGNIISGINPKSMDDLLIFLDFSIFKTHPTVLLEKITYPFLTDYLQIVYSLYYFYPVVLGIFLYSKRKELEFHRTSFAIALCFYLSYLGYIIVPAIGPRFTLSHLQSVSLNITPTTNFLQNLLNNLEGKHYDCFPSGHIGVSLVVLYYAFKYEKKIFYILLPLIVSLIFSTVYLRYHYVVDVFAGFFLTFLTLVISENIKLHPKLYRLS